MARHQSSATHATSASSTATDSSTAYSSAVLLGTHSEPHQRLSSFDGRPNSPLTSQHYTGAVSNISTVSSRRQPTVSSLERDMAQPSRSKDTPAYSIDLLIELPALRRPQIGTPISDSSLNRPSGGPKPQGTEDTLRGGMLRTISQDLDQGNGKGVGQAEGRRANTSGGAAIVRVVRPVPLMLFHISLNKRITGVIFEGHLPPSCGLSHA